MNGCVIPGTPIAVDFWKHWQNRAAKLFFLTHLHGDHIVGLTSSMRRTIHCSPVTAQILVERHGIQPSYVRSLEVGRSHLIHYCGKNCGHQKASEISGEQCISAGGCCDFVTVTVIYANHCAGAVMFLFEGPFGKILHTGDFRYSKELFDEGSPLSRHVGTIDCVYLDNTYCSPRCVFPSRLEALERIVEIVNSHKDHKVVFGVRRLGKEEILAAVAKAVDEWIDVPPVTYSIARILGLPNVFRTGEPHLRLRAVPFHLISSSYARRLNSEEPTIIILPTALYEGLDGKPYTNTPQVFLVPYSDHSSYPELLQFVSKLRPARVKPIVQGNSRGPFGKDVSYRADMSCFDKFLSNSKPGCPPLLAMPGVNEEEEPGSVAQTCCQFGFEAQFTDSQLAVQRRKRKVVAERQRRKASVPKGVNYFSDEEEEEGSPEGLQKAKKGRGRSSSAEDVESPNQEDQNQGSSFVQRHSEVCQESGNEDSSAVNPVWQNDSVSENHVPAVDRALPKDNGAVGVKDTHPTGDSVTQITAEGVSAKDTVDIASQAKSSDLSVKSVSSDCNDGPSVSKMLPVDGPTQDTPVNCAKDESAVNVILQKTPATDDHDTSAVNVILQKTPATDDSDTSAVNMILQKTPATDDHDTSAVNVILQKTPATDDHDTSAVNVILQKIPSDDHDTSAVNVILQKTPATDHHDTSAVNVILQKTPATDHHYTSGIPAVNIVPKKEFENVSSEEKSPVYIVLQEETPVSDMSSVNVTLKEVPANVSNEDRLPVDIVLREEIPVTADEVADKESDGVGDKNTPAAPITTRKKPAVKDAGKKRTRDHPPFFASSKKAKSCRQSCPFSVRWTSWKMKCKHDEQDLNAMFHSASARSLSLPPRSSFAQPKSTPCSSENADASESGAKRRRMHGKSSDKDRTCGTGSIDSVRTSMQAFLAARNGQKPKSNDQQRRDKMKDLYLKIFGPDPLMSRAAHAHSKVLRKKAVREARL